MKQIILIVLIIVGSIIDIYAQTIELSSKELTISWVQESDGWHIKNVTAGGRSFAHPAGYYDILYLNRSPAGGMVEQDLEGKNFTFYPSSVTRSQDGSLIFKHSLRVADIEAVWQIDPEYPTDMKVSIRMTNKAKGYVSIATPTIAVLHPDELSWGMVPGNWYGRELQYNLALAKQYSQGIPAVPALAKERNTMTLCPLLTTKDKLTLAVIPDPGTAADPWEADVSTRGQNKVAMSVVNRHSELSPVAYAPVLGQVGSQLQTGESVTFSFRYSIQAKDWFPVFSHVVNDIYQLPHLLELQQNQMSLSERVSRMQIYLRDTKRSAWKVQTVDGLEIGSNGSKNADVGIMLMLAKAGHDTILENRMPYVRNYKLIQQQVSSGFFQGAALGEYADEDGVESERGNWIEPLFTTYYTMMDIGNMLLFDHKDQELQDRLRMAADRMLAWQHADGSFDVAYDRFSHKSAFPDLQDLRPTWYGFLIAYRILGDAKYLAAAEKGAQWLIKNGVDKGYYLGVCGDARNIWDFCTAQSSEALLELFEITGNETYKKACIEAARVYTTSIFTHPVATAKVKSVNGVQRKDWEINQAGLSVEHIRGTAGGGPILISGHAGLFIRIFEYTGDSLFLTMARAASRGRNAYIDFDSGQSIYYWNSLDNVARGATIFPWHAYWQVGWITDYIMSEAHLRSKGQVEFPGGFMTPKVGPQISYGFAPGTVFSQKANLILQTGLIACDNPDMEYFTAISENGDKLYVIALNQAPRKQSGKFTIAVSTLPLSTTVRWKKETILQGKVEKINRNNGTFECPMDSWGMSIIVINLK